MRQIDDLGQIPEGSLLFFARPSALQTWAEHFGHEWRHVGVLVDTGAGLEVASYCCRKCFRTDDLQEILENYNRIGVAQVFETERELEGLRAFCRRFHHLERADAPYTFSGIFFGPLHLTFRRWRPGLVRQLGMALVALYCWWMTLTYGDRWAFGCSTFAWAAIHENRRTPLRVPLSHHPDDDAAYATRRTSRDDLYARWLCGPTELWQAISPGARTEIDLAAVASTDVVIDLREQAPSTTPACSATVRID